MKSGAKTTLVLQRRGFRPRIAKVNRRRLKEAAVGKTWNADQINGVVSSNTVKELKLQSRPVLSLVPPAVQEAAPGDVFDLDPQRLRMTFSGWLVPGIQPKTFLYPLTTEEFLQVNLATVRESNTHRHWPTEVVSKFLRTDVIKRSDT